VTRLGVHAIDWRSQFSDLRPFMDGQGGVVAVRTSDASPHVKFAKVLRQALDEQSQPCRWSTAQVDALNENTRYAGGVIALLEEKLEMLDVVDAVRDPRIVIGSDIEAGDAVTVSHVAVNYAVGSLDESRQLRRRAAAIGDRVRELAPDRRLALIVLNTDHEEARSMGDFCTMLWEPVLEPLVTECGLLVVDLADPRKPRDETWPPAPALTLDLPERYLGEDLVAAQEDVAKILIDECPDYIKGDAAAIAARAFLAGCDDVREAHARLSRLIATISARERS
jgi:hypothetical protein